MPIIKMTVDCSECGNNVSNPGIALMTGKKEGINVQTLKGLVACHSHFDRIKSKVHDLDEMADGPFWYIEEIEGSIQTRATLQHSERVIATDVGIFGYLTLEEAREYFPETFSKLAMSDVLESTERFYGN